MTVNSMVTIPVLSRCQSLYRLTSQRRFLHSKKSVTEVLSSSTKLNLNKAELRDYEKDHLHENTNISTTPQEHSSFKHGHKAHARPLRPRRPRHPERSYKSHRDQRDPKDYINQRDQDHKDRDYDQNEEYKARPKREAEEPRLSSALKYICKLKRVDFVPSEEFVQAQKPRNEDVPKLAHKLDRVLFSPGVHFLQDPRTRVFNFPPNLKNIVPYNNFDFDKISAFVSASKDKSLLDAAIKNGRTFYSSTSSMTSTLHQFYLLLNNYSSNERSQDRFDFPRFSRNATELPSSVIVEPKGINESTGENIYSVTSDKSTDVEILLSVMGHCLETLLTTEEEEFKKYLLDQKSPEANAPAENENAKESANGNANIYNYSAYGDFLMRSQLDCYDSRLPGNGTFDLKTRAVCAIRYDKASETQPTSYQIWKLNGKMESFEREYQDLIKTGGLLKYAFQARIGQMDGIFVAYHNISSFFGFQYLPLSELDKVFYSHSSIDELKRSSADANVIEAYDTHATAVAESQFKVSLNIWQDIMKTAINDLAKTKYKDMPFRLVMKRALKPVISAAEAKSKKERMDGPHDSFLRVYVVPLSKESVDELQGFSTQLQTSFRDDITTDQKIENLEATQKNLDTHNSKLLEDSILLSYNVWATLYHDGERLTGYGKHSYPMTSTGDSKWRYHIDQLVGDEESDKISKAKFLDLLKKATSLLTMSFKKRSTSGADRPSLIDNLRLYSEIGKKRLERWKEDENPPKVL